MKKNQMLLVIIAVLIVISLYLLGRYQTLVKKSMPSLLCNAHVGCEAAPPKGACAPGQACS